MARDHPAGPAGGNLLEAVPSELAHEAFTTLAVAGAARFERIVSKGQTTPPGDWYDQDWDEWVLVVEGAAEILLDGEPAPRRLERGDWVLIPRNLRHRVTWTDPARRTVWLAVHLGEPRAGTSR